jgi:hypothetical protein
MDDQTPVGLWVDFLLLERRSEDSKQGSTSESGIVPVTDRPG